MAKRDAPKKDNARGRSKAAGRAGTRTAQNKARRAEAHARKLTRKVEKRRLVILEVQGNDGSYRTATVRRKAAMRVQADRAAIQIGRIEKKAEQRREFAKLKPKEKAEHRAAGMRQFANLTD